MPKQLGDFQLQYLLSLTPVLDCYGDFIFIPHNKCAQTSINRGVLQDRVKVKKDDPDGYNKFRYKKEWENVFKFTIIRNPFDRVVSAFFYLQQSRGSIIDPSMSFSDFIEQGIYLPTFDPHFDPMIDRVFYRSQCLVDFIGRVENLERDWLIISECIPCQGHLPHKNKSIREKDYTKYYTKYYTDYSRKIIQDQYRGDLEIFGYKFGE